MRLEHGRAYQQMGDIQRKLGRLGESEAAYRKAIARCSSRWPASPAWGARRSGRWPGPAPCWATSWSAAGPTRARPTPLYRQALEAQRVLADARQDPAASAEDFLRLGQTYEEPGRPAAARRQARRGQAGLRPGHRRARAGARPATPRTPRSATSWRWPSTPAAGSTASWATWRRPRTTTAGPSSCSRSWSPSSPPCPGIARRWPGRCNSLGLIEQDTGRLADAEAHLRRELPLVERLAQDFPDRPEYRRVLARTLMNLGNVLQRPEPQRRRRAGPPPAVEVNAAIAAKIPDDVQIRLDLAKDHVNLGELLRTGGREPALASMRQRAIGEALVKEFPDKPRYRDQLAGTLLDLALALESVDPPRSRRPTASLAIYEKLVADHPENVEYRIDQCVACGTSVRSLPIWDGTSRLRLSTRKHWPCLTPRTLRPRRPNGYASGPLC